MGPGGGSQHRNLVALARQMVAGRTWADDTAQQYRHAVNRLASAGQRPEHYAKSPASFYFYRAALIHAVVTRLTEVLETIDGRPDEQGRDDLIGELASLVAVLEDYPPDPEHRALGGELQSPFSGERRKRQTKRSMLGRLPTDWREQIWRAALACRSRYLPHLALSILAGPRPVDFVNGIGVRHEDGRLVFAVKPSKTHGGRFGLGDRGLAVALDRAPAIWLAEWVGGYGAATTISVPSGYLLRDAYKHFSRQVWPRRRIHVTPYTFRHQLAADLKSDDGFDELTIAKVLGHCSTATQGCYGRPSQAKGQVALIAEALASVREPRVTGGQMPPSNHRSILSTH